MSNQLINELRSAVMQEPNDTSRVGELQRSLARHGNEVVKELDSLLNDSLLNVSEAAADILELIGSEAAYDALLDYALAHFNDPTGQTKLPGPGWRRLRQLGKPVLPALARHYDGSLPFGTRLTIVFIAQQIADPAAVPLLEQALSEPDSRLVEAAGEALGVVDGPDAYDRLIQLLNSNDGRHRLGAIRGLARLGNGAAVRPLLDILMSSDQPLPSWSLSLADARVSLHTVAADVIDSLSGQTFRGDVDKIQAWLQTHSTGDGG